MFSFLYDCAVYVLSVPYAAILVFEEVVWPLFLSNHTWNKTKLFKLNPANPVDTNLHQDIPNFVPIEILKFLQDIAITIAKRNHLAGTGNNIQLLIDNKLDNIGSRGTSTLIIFDER